MTAFLVGAAIGAAIIVGLFAVLYLRGVREDREAYPPMPPEEVAAKLKAWRGSSSCSKCRASSADGGPMICDRDGCPGEAARLEREAMKAAIALTENEAERANRMATGIATKRLLPGEVCLIQLTEAVNAYRAARPKDAP